MAGLPCSGDRVPLSFSPDDTLLITGTSLPKSTGEVVMMDVATHEEATRISVGANIGVRDVIWHGGLGQILVACTDGAIRAYYNTKTSVKGVMLPMKKKAKRPDAVVDELLHVDFVPGDVKKPVRALDKKWRERLDIGAAAKRMVPPKPTEGHGESGKLGDNLQTYM